MNLLEEIISLASSEQGSIATLLRKCLVLAHIIKNDRLKIWAEKELNGYLASDEIPEYRKIIAHAKGLFLGGFNSQIDQQPIPSAVLEKEDRHWAESMDLLQPIASYENGDSNKNLMREWPANLTIKYQSTFFEGSYALNRAWQEISRLTIVGFLDTVKTRVLQLALEFKDIQIDTDIKNLPAEKVDQTIINIIYGGQNIITSTGPVKIDNIQIIPGDWNSLSTALKENLGFSLADISELKTSIEADSVESKNVNIGSHTLAWLKKSSSSVLKVGKDIAEKVATELILKYLGVDPS